MAAGVQANDRIARIEKNAPDYFELAFAASKINAVLVDVNWRLAPAEMRQIVDDARAKVLFVGEEFAPHLDKIESELATVERTVLLGAADATHESIDDLRRRRSRPTDPGVEGGAAGHLPAALHVGHHRAAQGRDAQQREPLRVHRRGAEDLGLHARVGVARGDAHVPHRRLRMGARQPGHGRRG